MSNDGNEGMPRRTFPLPGMAAICFYILLLAGVIILGVVSGQHYPPFFLFFAAAFLTASAGLVMSFRWAWALALGAVSLLAAYNLFEEFVDKDLFGLAFDENGQLTDHRQRPLRPQNQL